MNKATFYLFDSTVRTHTDVFSANNIAPPIEATLGQIAEVELRTAIAGVRAFVYVARENEPSWAQWARANLVLDSYPPITNVANGLIVVIEADVPNEGTRFFALTVGIGFSLLDRARIQQDFGLNVALNTLQHSSLRHIGSKTVGTVTRQKELSINKPAEVWEFGIDPDLELLGRLSGKPSDAQFAKTLTGADALALHRDISLADVRELCVRFYEYHNSTAYREHFAFVDRLRPLKKGPLTDQLDGELADLVATRVTEGVSVFLPSSLVNLIEKYEVRSDRGVRALSEFNIDGLYDALDYLEIRGPSCLTDATIAGHSAEDRFILNDPLSRHIVHEGVHQGEFYAYTGGKWFRIAKDFVEQVNNQIETIDVVDLSGVVPSMHVGEHEGVYNARAAQHADIVLFDRLTFAEGLPTFSKIEVCDLFHRENNFIAVKKFGGSDDMSHLFSQGSVSAVLFCEHLRYREFAAAQISNCFAVPFDVRTPNRQSITFTFAVCGDQKLRNPSGLPFFSKVNLLRHFRTVTTLGLVPKYAWIPLEDADQNIQPRRRSRRRHAAN